MPELVLPRVIEGGWRELPFEPFRCGIEVSWLSKGGPGEPTTAILRYQPGATVPRHRHEGLETILVLEGSQTDESGTYGTGTLVLNAKGSEHSVWSELGCVVFIQWDLPVKILEAEDGA